MNREEIVSEVIKDLSDRYIKGDNEGVEINIKKWEETE